MNVTGNVSLKPQTWVRGQSRRMQALQLLTELHAKPSEFSIIQGTEKSQVYLAEFKDGVQHVLKQTDSREGFLREMLGYRLLEGSGTTPRVVRHWVPERIMLLEYHAPWCVEPDRLPELLSQLAAAHAWSAARAHEARLLVGMVHDATPPWVRHERHWQEYVRIMRRFGHLGYCSLGDLKPTHLLTGSRRQPLFCDLELLSLDRPVHLDLFMIKNIVGPAEFDARREQVAACYFEHRFGIARKRDRSLFCEAFLLLQDAIHHEWFLSKDLFR
jgi:hypothetical protein